MTLVRDSLLEVKVFTGEYQIERDMNDGVTIANTDLVKVRTPLNSDALAKKATRSEVAPRNDGWHTRSRCPQVPLHGRGSHREQCCKHGPSLHRTPKGENTFGISFKPAVDQAQRCHCDGAFKRWTRQAR